MRDTFDAYGMAWIESREGYLSNLAGDSGGLTIFGIASTWHAEEVRNMQAMSRTDARIYAASIYMRDYWLEYSLDAQPWPMDLVLFDTVVQHSPPTIVKVTEPDGGTPPCWQMVLLRRLMHYQEKTRGRWQNRGGLVNRIADLARFIADHGGKS